MTENSEIVQLNTDPVNVFHELTTNTKNSIAYLSSSALRGIKENNLKDTLIQAIDALAKKGEIKIDAWTTAETSENNDELAEILSQIEEGINLERFTLLKNMYIKFLKDGTEDRVYLRKLMSIVRDLEIDELIVLRSMTFEELNEKRSRPGIDYVAEIAKFSGLKNPGFVYAAIDTLMKKSIVTSNYTDYRSPPLTPVGQDIGLYFDATNMPE
ncbi:MAG: hypothetical protein WAQ27_03655 [Candidatus Microsaccharimonas sp.]